MAPERFTPLYDLVSFSTVPYTEAKARGAANVRAVSTAITLFVIAIIVAVMILAVLLARFALGLGAP
jgi:ascorbate-specific PTS system EIIC-type component UlaA